MIQFKHVELILFNSNYVYSFNSKLILFIQFKHVELILFNSNYVYSFNSKCYINSIQTAYINSVQTVHTYLIQISVGTFNSIIFIFIQSSWDRARADKSTWDRTKNLGRKLSLRGNYACVDCLPYV